MAKRKIPAIAKVKKVKFKAYKLKTGKLSSTLKSIGKMKFKGF